MDPLLAYMKQLGEKHGGKTHTQVALNYLVSQGNVMPIPGAKTAAQAQEFAGALVRTLREPAPPL
jgi:aryl-alcohol dehydrogenase-like predicted oxidoreductase